MIKGVLLLIGEITNQEVELINLYAKLSITGRRELKEYLSYLLAKQYKKEVMNSVFNNKLMQNLLHNLMYIVEKEDFDILQVTRRIIQIKELYYNVFGQVHLTYAELIPDLDSNEIVREFGLNSFENLNSALLTEDHNKIRYEVISFHQEFISLSKKKDARQIAAV